MKSVRSREGKDQGDLLTGLEGESWLIERLKQHGIDVYRDGDFPSWRERLAYVIREYRYGPVVAGRGPNGKPESYEQVFERIYGMKLKDACKPYKTQRQQETGS